MKQSYVIILLVLFALVSGLYYYQERPKHRDIKDLFTEIVPQFSLESVNEIKAWTKRDQGPPFCIKRQEDSYWIEVQEDNSTFLAPCQKGRVRRLLESLRGLRGEERAKGKAHFKTFSIGDSTSLNIVLKKGDSILSHILVGERGPSWDTSFVRKEGDDRVFLVEKNLLSLFDIWNETAKANPSPGSWIDLGVVKDGYQDVEGVSYSGAGEVWSLTRSSNVTSIDHDKGSRKEGSWKLVRDGVEKGIQKDQAEDFLKAILPLYAKAVEPPGKAGQFGLGEGAQDKRFTIHFRSKGLKILHIGSISQKDKAGWIQDDRGVIFRVSEDLLKKIQRGPGSKKRSIRQAARRTPRKRSMKRTIRR